MLCGSIGLTEAVDCGRCFCTTDFVTGDQNVICLGVPFAEIKTTFAADAGFLDINRFDVVPEVGDSIIPAELLGSHRARIIHLASCGVNLMEIDAEAFKSSSTITEEFTSINCDVGKITWSFLNGFSSLNLLQLEGASKIQSLGSLPSLPSLKRLSLTTCQGFGPLTFPGTSLTELQILVMTENGAELTHRKVESILRTLTAAKTFQFLSLKDNPSINRIPDALAMLTALHSLDLSLCDIATVTSGSLSFSAPAVKTLSLENSKLSTISDNSFDNGMEFYEGFGCKTYLNYPFLS